MCEYSINVILGVNFCGFYSSLLADDGNAALNGKDRILLSKRHAMDSTFFYLYKIYANVYMLCKSRLEKERGNAGTIPKLKKKYDYTRVWVN